MSHQRLSLAMLVAGLLLYAGIVAPFASYMAHKPVVEKLGFVPSFKLIKPLSADQKEIIAASLVTKVLIYFGGSIGKETASPVVAVPSDLQGMSRLLHGAVQLDHYNMDAYYFAQGFLTWDAKQYKVANDLLEYGMKYRTWDWYLPFFAGFNHAFFLKDYGRAAELYQRAGELSGEGFHKSLASRYLQESGHTALAIIYLTAMEKNEKNAVMRQSYRTRLKAFRETLRTEQARDRFRKERGTLPSSVEQLVQAGFLTPSPVDPYGGSFYLEPDGKVSTTSKYAFVGGKGDNKNAGN